MPYTAPTLAEALTALAARLNDPTNTRWSLAELQVYLVEALRTWSVWTQHWRDRGTFQTTMLEPFYDLAGVLFNLRGQTVTNWDLVTDLQYALLEPAAPGGTWTGTDQFTLAQLSTAIQRRRDQFLRDTGTVLTRTVVPQPTPPSDGRIALDESVLIVRRAAWRITATGTLYPLLVTDEWAANTFQRTWPISTRPPQAYAVSVTPPLTFQLIPPSTDPATLDLVSITKGTAVDPLVERTLGIPDDYCWVIKFGALADLLNGDGLALDPVRAAYCEQRWQQGVDHIRRNAVVLAATISDDASPTTQLPCAIASLSDADRYSPLWQLVAGVPRTILLAGHNLIACWPPPGATGGPWTIGLDVVRTAPVPVNPLNVLQISADIYDSILDLAQHLALFKEGPGQLDLATPLLDRAARAAGVDVRLQQAAQPSRAPLLGQTPQDRRAVAEQRAVPATSQLVEVD